MTNNTITENGRNGISCYNNNSRTITNNIIIKNGITNTSAYGISAYSSNPTINYNNVWGNGQTGTQNYGNCIHGPEDISANPQFISQSNFHLQPTSPCIDKGSNTAPAIPSTDKDGKPRIIDGDNDGIATVDMGAYEFQPHGFAVEINLTLSTNTITADGTITCTVYGTDSNGVSWDATSEAIFSTTDPKGSWVANIYDPGKVGIWTITAKIQGQSGTLTATAIVTVSHGLPVSLIIGPANITLNADQSQCYKGTATDSDSNPWDATGEITWTEDDPDGTISSSGIYYAGRVGIWTITGRTINGKVGTTSVIVTSGGITLLFAPTNNNAFAYPNPWKKNDLKQGGEYILFDRVSSGATIRIYNIAGELINKIDVTECPQKWDILNKNIASGVYIYVITGGGGGKKVGKIGIVK